MPYNTVSDLNRFKDGTVYLLIILYSLNSRYIQHSCSSLINVYVHDCFLETSQHQSCCVRKEVNGIQYEHIDDHDMLLPDDCKDHCVYKVVGETEDKLYCFEVGDLTTKCLEAGEHGECSSGPIAPARTSKN